MTDGRHPAAFDSSSIVVGAVLEIDLSVMVVVFLERLSVCKDEGSWAVFGALVEAALVEGAIFPLVFAFAVELVFRVGAGVGVTSFKPLMAFAVFEAVVELALEVMCFFFVIEQFTYPISET